MLRAASLKFVVDLGAGDDQGVGDADLAELVAQGRGLGVLQGRRCRRRSASRPWPWRTAHGAGPGRGPSWAGRRRGCGPPDRGPWRRRRTGPPGASRDGRRRCPSACTSSCPYERPRCGPGSCGCPTRRLASCQVTQRCRMSARISSMPKMSSGQLDRAALPAVQLDDVEFHYASVAPQASARSAGFRGRSASVTAGFVRGEPARLLTGLAEGARRRGVRRRGRSSPRRGS